MKKCPLLFLIILLCLSSVAFSVNFFPTLLKVSAPPYIQYNFDGTQLNIPVTVKGTPASMFFMVYTKDMAQQIVNVHNGYLGYHYMNKVDTCIYLSPVSQFGTGSNVLQWDGTDVDGKKVPAGSYTYYIWAFDNVNVKQKVTQFVDLAPWSNLPTIEQVGPDGKLLANPLIHVRNKRWVIGNDPSDSTLLETSNVVLPDVGFGELEAYHPTDWNYLYVEWFKMSAETLGWSKFKWVPNGDAILDPLWGNDMRVNIKFASYEPGIVTDGNYLYSSEDHETDTVGYVPFHVIDFDGTIAESYDLSTWLTKPEGVESGCTVVLNMGVNSIRENKGMVFPFDPGGCVHMMLDPMRALDSGNPDDYIVWVNQNGDWVNDKNFKETDKCPWDCMASGPPYKYSLDADANQFMAVTQSGMGAVSFTLSGPDGKGIGFFAFAGETAESKTMCQFVDSNTAFDGIYADNSTSAEVEKKKGIWYVGHDSIKGVITNQVDVAEAPEAFAVQQNSPNPFNPSTAINFTTVQAGNVSVAIYNVAGQKVDTLHEGFLGAGSHTLTWDASDFSAGVYFYTVTSGDFSKTLKMTLLK